ncbi:hypothetical protein WJX73_000438 [Symbiochloris irregularis]|uniref:Uncharacterized protein n=1 Tax=Symbiochloris irregularis TaxID=706552 RepID=A0AAW1P0L5_9CHLO
MWASTPRKSLQSRQPGSSRSCTHYKLSRRTCGEITGRTADKEADTKLAAPLRALVLRCAHPDDLRNFELQACWAAVLSRLLHSSLSASAFLIPDVTPHPGVARACFGSAAPALQPVSAADEVFASKFVEPVGDINEASLHAAFLDFFGAQAESIWVDMIQRAATWRAMRGRVVLPNFERWSMAAVVMDMLHVMQPNFTPLYHPPELAYAIAGHMFYNRSCTDADRRALDAMLEDLRPLPDADMCRIEHYPAVRVAELGHLLCHIASWSEQRQRGLSYEDGVFEELRARLASILGTMPVDLRDVALATRDDGLTPSSADTPLKPLILGILLCAKGTAPCGVAGNPPGPTERYMKELRARLKGNLLTCEATYMCSFGHISGQDRCPPHGAGRVLLWNELQGTVLGCVVGLQDEATELTSPRFGFAQSLGGPVPTHFFIHPAACSYSPLIMGQLLSASTEVLMDSVEPELLSQASCHQTTIDQFFSVQADDVCTGGDMLTLCDGQETDLADYDPGRTQLQRRTCTSLYCDRFPRYAVPGGCIATHCGQCRLPGMVHFVDRRCDMPGCSIQPSFGFPGGPRKSCAAHKAFGMESKTVKCQHAGCHTSPAFGIPGGARRWCGLHRSDGGPEVEYLVQKCQHEGCNTTPSFGLEGTAQRLWCRDHRDDGGEGVTTLDHKCDHDDCTVAPRFGYPGGPRQWCKTHKGDGGEAVRFLGDQCKVAGCFKQPCYGFLAPAGAPSTREWQCYVLPSSPFPSFSPFFGLAFAKGRYFVKIP